MKRKSSVTEWSISGPKAAKVIGITYRQIDHWDTTKLVQPSITEAEGSGTRRQYSYSDLMDLMVVKTLADFGVGFDLVRKIIKKVGGTFLRADHHWMLSITPTQVKVVDITEIKDLLAQEILVMVPLVSLREKLANKLADEWRNGDR